MGILNAAQTRYLSNLMSARSPLLRVFEYSSFTSVIFIANPSPNARAFTVPDTFL